MNQTYDRIPPTLRRYEVSRETIERTREFLLERGEQGVEGVVLWLGIVIDAQRALVLSELIPPQVAFKTEHGVAVHIPDEVVAELIGALPERVFILCRVHSHPGPAYHSETDDENMIISHRGAISIVVPQFAARPMILEQCSVNVLGADHRWRELTPDEVRDRFEVVG